MRKLLLELRETVRDEQPEDRFVRLSNIERWTNMAGWAWGRDDRPTVRRCLMRIASTAVAEIDTLDREAK